jgi:transcriptional regulator of acetoin/glycerol metabolism
VLDVSSARHDVSRQSQFHTMALVNLSAKMIESCYFLRHFDNQWLLRFHLQAESVGLFSEGLLAFDGEGRICAVNQSALNLLGHIRGGLLGKPVEAFFDCSLDELLGRASANASASWPLRTRDGRHLFAAAWRVAPRRCHGRPVVAKLSHWRASASVTPRCKRIFARRCGCSSATCRC